MSSNPRVTSSNPWVTSSNPPVSCGFDYIYRRYSQWKTSFFCAMTMAIVTVHTKVLSFSYETATAITLGNSNNNNNNSIKQTL